MGVRFQIRSPVLGRTPGHTRALRNWNLTPIFPVHINRIENRRGDPLLERGFGPVVFCRNRPGDAAQLTWQRGPDQQKVGMALMIRKIDALLGLGRAALPARLRAGERSDQAEQEKTHQLR